MPFIADTATTPAPIENVMSAAALDPGPPVTTPPAPLDPNQPYIILPGTLVPVTIQDTNPWYSPAPAPPVDPATAAVAVAAPVAGDLPAVGVGAVAGPTNAVTPPPFSDGGFPVQAPGSFVSPIGGGALPLAAGGFASVSFPSWATGGRVVSGSSHESIAGIGPSLPHSAFRPGLGGIARVLAGLGLVGHSRLPRELERHASHRTPLTP